MFLFACRKSMVDPTFENANMSVTNAQQVPVDRFCPDGGLI